MSMLNCAIRISVLAVFLILSVVAVKAQDSIRQKPVSPQRIHTVIKTNPLPIIWGPVPLTSEFRIIREIAVSQNQSVEFGFSYLGKSPLFSLMEKAVNTNNQAKIIVRGFRVQMAHKFYIDQLFERAGLLDFEYAPIGFYVAPHISYSTAKLTIKYLNTFDHYIRGTHFNINLIGGYQAILLDGFAIDFFAGMGYKENSWFEHLPPNTVTPLDMGLGGFYNSNFKLVLGFNVGVAF